MAITLDELKRMVFPGESGGDYNALFGYAHRPGKQFAGVNLTDMTVDQALQFSDPSGAYGQYVLRNRPDPEMGVATPMGAWQVVGKTLAAAKSGLGLTGSERMTPDLQDKIGMWIYQKQGPGAWQGWGKGGSNAVAGGAGNDRFSGGTGMGLLDMQEQPQTFKDRLRESWKSGELLENLALATNSLRFRPDPNLAAGIEASQQRRADKQTANRTAQWLISQGREDLAQAMLSGAIDPKTAASAALTPVKDDKTAMIQNYEFWIAQGKTPEEAQALVNSGSVTNINMPNESQGALNKELAKNEAGIWSAYMQQGSKAASAKADLSMLQEVLQYAPQDPITGRLAQAFPGFSSAGAAASSIIKRVAPTLRVEGSGSTSDIEYAGMLDSLPSLQNYPEANAAILSMMQAKADIDMQRSQIISGFLNSDQSPEQARVARAQLSELNGRSIMTPQLQQIIGNLGGGGGGDVGGGANFTYNPQTDELE